MTGTASGSTDRAGSQDGVGETVVSFQVERGTAKMVVTLNGAGAPSYVRVALGWVPTDSYLARHEAKLEVLNRGLRKRVPLETLFALLYDEDGHSLGRTEDPDIPTVPSVFEYVIRWLALHHLSFEVRNELGVLMRDEVPVCLVDGSKMLRAGSCFVCPECGATSGCS